MLCHTTLYCIAFAPPRKSGPPDKASVYAQEQLGRRDFCDRAKLRRADLERGASHIG